VCVSIDKTLVFLDLKTSGSEWDQYTKICFLVQIPQKGENGFDTERTSQTNCETIGCVVADVPIGAQTEEMIGVIDRTIASLTTAKLTMKGWTVCSTRGTDH